MHLLDWRDPSAPSLSDVWTEQAARWDRHLSWDSAANWAAVDAQRRAGRLPGLMLLDGAHVAAWSFFLVHHDTLQIGAFEAESSVATRTLLDAVLSTVAPDVTPSGAMAFAFSEAPGLLPALVARGFEVERYLYLVCDMANARPTPTGALPWAHAAAEHLPSLLARAYGPPALTRPFARHGRADEWREYAGQLLVSGACGRFEPEFSSARLAADGTLDGAAITTIVGPGTAHIAQLAVDPSRRRCGLAAALIHQVIEQATSAGLARVSLLVSERNTPAMRLYGKVGFRETARFIAAGRGVEVPRSLGGPDGYPRRSTSPAFETGGASTFR